MTAPVPGVGPQLARAADGTDPRGVLTFEYLPENLQASEDATLAADRERWSIGPRRLGFEPHRYGFTRPATDTERILLQHLGYTLPDQLTTVVTFKSRSVRHRSWPTLEGNPS